MAMLIAGAVAQLRRPRCAALRNRRGCGQVALNGLVDLRGAREGRQVLRQGQVEGTWLRGFHIVLARLGPSRQGQGQDGRDQDQVQA
ncbi:MAG: hypothetical protein A2X71_08530 [Thiobacillus sp. GWE1_62_9]|nr:MAG: hypothetical protein A2X71_08530 [Thiobacillus sp. GWE1_62_9]